MSRESTYHESLPASSLRRLGRILWSPSAGFADLRENPSWLGAFLVVGLGTASIAWVTIPAFQEVALRSLPGSAPAEQLARIHEVNRLMRCVSTAGAALGTLAGWFVSAVVMWLIVQVFEGRGGFKLIFSVVSHSSLVSLFYGIVAAAIVLMRVTDETAGLQDLQASLGADLLLQDSAHPSLKAVLASLNPFAFWYYSLLAIGIATACRIKRSHAVWAVGIFWLLAMAFGAGVAWVATAFQPPTTSL